MTESVTTWQPTHRLIVLAVPAGDGPVEVLPVVAVETRLIRDADGDERVEHFPVVVWGGLHTVDHQFAAVDAHTFFTVPAPWPPEEDAARLADTTAEAKRIAPRVAEIQREIRAIREKWEATP